MTTPKINYLVKVGEETSGYETLHEAMSNLRDPAGFIVDAHSEQPIEGRGMCAWCGEDLGVVPSIPAGKVTHGMCWHCEMQHEAIL